MYADRRIAFEARIGELFNDHKAAYPVRNMSKNVWRDLGSRILSALEDSFQMGRHDPKCLRCGYPAIEMEITPYVNEESEKNG